MANTKTYTGGSKSSSPWREIRIVLEETATNVTNNTSTIAYEVWLDNGNTYFNTIKIGCKVVIDSVTVLDRAYSSSSQYSCSKNSSVKIASGTTTVTHGTDGTKSIASGKISATCSSAGVVATQTVTSNSAWALTTIARASSVSISTNTTVMGQARTITITRASSSFTHTLTYTFGSASGTIATKTASTSVSFTPPASLAAQLTNAKSGTGTITCTTYNGDSSIGSSTCSFTATIPASSITLSGGTWIGDALTITLGRASSNITHTLTYKFGTQTSATQIATGVGASTSWTPTSAQKTAMVQAVATDNASGSGTITCTTYNGTATIGTTTKTWTGKIPASTFTRSSASVTMGGSQTFTITRAGSNITHKLTYAFGSLSNQSIGTGIGTSKSWTVPTSLASQLSNASSGTCTVTLTTYNGTVTCGSTSTVTFTAVAPASTFTLSATSVAMGTGTLTITINRATTNMTHTVAYKFNSDSSYTNISTTAGDSASWSPAYTLASKIPSATSGTWNISVTTKIGTATVGSASVKNVTLTVPNNSTTQPTLASISYAPSPNNVSPSGHSNFNGMYIVGMSKVSATFTPTTKYSATIPSTGAVLSVGGATAASGTATSGTAKTLTASKVISSAGSLTAFVKVTDSRGYVKQSANQTITAYAYSEPAVVPKSGASKVVCGRSTQSGTLSSSGTFLHIEAGRTITSLNSKNYGSLEYKLYNSSGTLIKSEYILAATATATESVSFTSSSAIVSDLTSTYRVVLTAYDRFGNDTTYTINIPTDSITMDLRPGGTGVGIGMYSQGANRLDVGWESYFSHRILLDRISSLKTGSVSGVRSHVVVAEALNYQDVGLPVSQPGEVFAEAWLKTICEQYPDYQNTIFIGQAVTGSSAYIICFIYDTSITQNGIPQYSFGIYVPYTTPTAIGVMSKFGTAAYTYYFHNINRTATETGTMTYDNTQTIISEAQFGTCVLRRSGNVCSLRVSMTPTSGSSTSFVNIGTIPTGFRPSEWYYWSFPGWNSPSTMYGIQIGTSGQFQLYKNNSSTTTIRATLTWITA